MLGGIREKFMNIYEANGNRFLIGSEEIEVEKMCKEYECDGYLKVHSHRMQVFNADNSEAMLCINGLACFANYLSENKKEYKQMALVIGSEVYACEIVNHQPFICRLRVKKPKIFRNFVNVGNNHLILVDEKKDHAESLCKRFDCNISYVNILNRKCLEVVTYERGVGFTRSCGSGNLASSYYCYVNDLCDNCLDILNIGGISSVEIKTDMVIQIMSRFVREI